ncbi:hypothetical protein RchiOBHm_Chr7g0232581 [Rosa chinensis]|uniref:DOG1 domain-containing protein n=1 Tax=Rosa chinensis TaxID=74649 RepID=A0A2P6PFZ5_ROSCH|nr:hypothetical protein RchiOBHm_Chr7g0232581 [Rosa chinensis]
MILRMVETSVQDLKPDQARELEEKMARIQESVAAPPILETARRVGRLMDGKISTLDEAMEALKAKMLRLTESADGLRGSTARKVVEVLSPSQSEGFGGSVVICYVVFALNSSYHIFF